MHCECASAGGAKSGEGRTVDKCHAVAGLSVRVNHLHFGIVVGDVDVDVVGGDVAVLL